MVNIVAHGVFAAFESDGDVEPHEGELTEVLHEADPRINQSCFGDWLPQNSIERRGLSKNLIRSFGAVTKIKRRRKNSSDKMAKFLSEMAGERLKRYSLKQLNLFTQNFSTVLGLGGFGRVYKGKLPSGMAVAVKRLADWPSMEQQLINEVSILARTNHRNLIRLFGFCVEANIVALVYEYMENRSLDKILFHNHLIIDWEKLYHLSIQTAKGITYLHEDCQQMIIHYDIKPANILLDSNFSPKIADFGLAEMYDRDVADDIKATAKGTFGYLAPELYMSSVATCKCDVYSFGMVLFAIVTRKNHVIDHRRPGWFPAQVWEELEKGKVEELLAEHGVEEKYTEQAKRMCMAALWCVQYSPENRPSMSSVVNILKGNIEAKKPPNPFLGFSELYSSWSTSTGSDFTRAERVVETNSEIEMVTSSENLIIGR